MANRKDLELRAAKANVVSANYPNDSKFEQAILYAEKNSVTSSTATTIATPATAAAGVSGDKNI